MKPMLAHVGAPIVKAEEGCMTLGVCHLQGVPQRVPDVDHMTIFYENLW